MSIEKTMEALTEALNAHTKALTAFVSANKGGAAASTGKPAAEGTKAAGAKATGKTKITLEKLTEAVGAYLSVKDKDEKKERAGHIKAMNEHFGVERISLVDEAEYGKVLEMLKQYENGEDPLADGEGEGDEGDSII